MTKVDDFIAIVGPLALVAACSAACSSGSSGSPGSLGMWTPTGAPSSAAPDPTAAAAGSSSGDVASASGSGSSSSGGGSSGASQANAGGASGAPSSVSGSSGGSSSSGVTHDAGPINGPPPAAGAGLPCDVATVLASKCTSCHSDPPINNSLAGLMTHADLLATAKEDPTKNEAQLSLVRMQNTASPMPPAALNAPPTASDISTLQSWISAGYPTGSCGSDGGTPIEAGPSIVVFDVFQGKPFAPGTGSNSHNAGQDCMRCHAGGGDDAPKFSLGGTIYDLTGNPVGGAEIRVADQNGAAFSVYSGSNGTFHSSTTFSASAHVGARTATTANTMISLLSYGGCSKCHGTGAGFTTIAVHVP
jgi:hypothetical protein